MSTISLYRDEECKDLIGSGFIGTYGTISGMGPSIQTNIKQFTIDETEYTFRALGNYLNSRNDRDEAGEIELPLTDSSTFDNYVYITPDLRIPYFNHKNGIDNYSFGIQSMEFYYQNNWTVIGMGTYGVMSWNSSGNGPLSISFRGLKSGASYEGWWEPIPLDEPYDINFLGINTHSKDQQGRGVMWICVFAVSQADVLLDTYEPKPYKPETGNRGKTPTGTGYYPNSIIPKLPTAALNSVLSSVLGRGSGLTYYKLTGSALEEVTECMYQPFTLNKHRPEAFASCILVPCNVNTVTNTLRAVYLADKTITVDRGGTCNFVVEPLHEVDFGEINLTADSIGYTDFSDITHTSAVLYLPCVGGINVDLAFMQGGQLKLEAVIDARNGNILYRLLSRASEDELWVLYGQYSGNCGMPLAICGGSTGDIMGTVRGISSTMAGALSPASFVGGGLELASSLMSSVVDKSNLIQPACGVYGTNKPFLIISKTIKLSAPNYSGIIGHPSAGYNEDEKYTFGNFKGTGFFKATACHVDGINCTDGEKAEIERLLLEGVYA